jgi:hypothetical protein
VKVWTGFNWLRIGTSEGREHDIEPSVSIKGEFEKLSDYQLLRQGSVPWGLF